MHDGWTLHPGPRLLALRTLESGQVGLVAVLIALAVLVVLRIDRMPDYISPTANFMLEDGRYRLVTGDALGNRWSTEELE